MPDESNGNGRATIREVYALVGKVDDKLDLLNDKVDKHLIDAVRRDERVAALELWKSELPDRCDMRVREMIRADHKKMHGEHMSKDHLHPNATEEKEDEDGELSDMRRVWRAGKWVILLVVGWAVLLGLNTWVRNSHNDEQTQLLQQRTEQLQATTQEILNYLQIVDPEETPMPRATESTGPE